MTEYVLNLASSRRVCIFKQVVWKNRCQSYRRDFMVAWACEREYSKKSNDFKTNVLERVLEWRLSSIL